MPLIVSNTATNLMREYLQDQATRLSLHPATPTPANEIPSASGYSSPSLSQASWSDTEGGNATNTLPFTFGTLVATVASIANFALRDTDEEVLLANSLTTARGPLAVGTRLAGASGALNLSFISQRGAGNRNLAISNTLRTGLINLLTTNAATASLHSAQPTDAARPSNDMEIPTSSGYRRSPLNAANWSSPALDGVSRNQVILRFGSDLSSAVATVSHIALRNAAGVILVENDLTTVLRNLSVGANITVPANDITIRMVA